MVTCISEYDAFIIFPKPELTEWEEYIAPSGMGNNKYLGEAWRHQVLYEEPTNKVYRDYLAVVYPTVLGVDPEKHKDIYDDIYTGCKWDEYSTYAKVRNYLTEYGYLPSPHPDIIVLVFPSSCDLPFGGVYLGWDIAIATDYPVWRHYFTVIYIHELFHGFHCYHHDTPHPEWCLGYDKLCNVMECWMSAGLTPSHPNDLFSVDFYCEGDNLIVENFYNDYGDIHTDTSACGLFGYQCP